MRFLFLIMLVLLLLPPMARAQAKGEGVVQLTNWPARQIAAGEIASKEVETWRLLPYVDTLALGYRYGIRDGRPFLTYTLEWVPGAQGVLKGKKVPVARLPDDVRLTALELHADVLVNGQAVADLLISLDDLELKPRPGLYHSDRQTLRWSEVFVNTPADSARALFEEGFALANLTVLRAAFDSFDGPYTQLAERSPRKRRERAAPTVFTIDPGIWLNIWITGPPRRPRWDPGADRTPRGATGRGGDTDASAQPGRSQTGTTQDTAQDAANDTDAKGDRSTRRASGSTTRSTGKGKTDGKDKKDEDDEDDETLLPAALVGAAAVGAFAVAGGTVGYYGNMDHAPIGLTAGFVRPGWGTLLQVGINEAVLTDHDEPERLTAKLLGFYDAFDAPVMPLLGAGVLATQENDRLELEPSLSVGAALQLGPVLLLGGYDVTAQGAEVGIAYNFRYRPPRP